VTQRIDIDPATTDPELPALRGERLAGIVLSRSGPLAAGLVTATGLLAAVLVPIGGWRSWLVVPLLLLIAVALVRLVQAVPAPPVPRWTALSCLAIAVAHGWWAAATRSEHVVLRRDAGSYALYTQWIATHHKLPLPSFLDAFGGPAALTDPAFRLASPAFFAVQHGAAGAAGTSVDIVPQFLLGAPAVYSLGWWADGWNGLLIAPAIVSALALLAVAGLAARLCGARWAAPVVAALALAQPVLHAARSTYSEPPSLLLLAAASALLFDAVKSGNRGRAQTRALALAAGLGFGLAGLVRVDSIREVAFLLPVAAVLALRGHPAARPLVVGALGGTAVAAIPALLLSRPYLGAVAASLVPLLAGGLLLGVLSLVVVKLAARKTVRETTAKPEKPKSPWPRRWPRLMAGAVIAVGLILASRPLWMTVHQDPNDPGSRVVAGLQLRQGLAIDGGRTYAEHSVNWVSWYLGPVMLLAALLLMAGLAHRATRWWLKPITKLDVPPWLGPAVIGLAGTLLTLYRPGITPDHPWADRRLVPLVLPTVVIAAGAAVAWTGRLARRRWPASLLIAVLVAAAVSMLVPPALATASVAGKRTETGELKAVQKVCDQLKPGDVVLAVDARAANEWPQVIRGVCGRPVASIKVADATQAGPAVQRIAARIVAAGGHPVLLAALPEGQQLQTQLQLTPVPVVNLTTTEDQRYLTKVPDGVDPLVVQVWLARWPVPVTG
jgi:hypothetical protein